LQLADSRLGVLPLYAAAAATPAVGLSANESVLGSPDHDPAYMFRYATADAEREEVGDGRGRVRGRYSYITSPGGPRISVVYSAAPETGFVVENAPGVASCSYFEMQFRGPLALKKSKNNLKSSIRYLFNISVLKNLSIQSSISLKNPRTVTVQSYKVRKK
jgi:hypothetical protein